MSQTTVSAADPYERQRASILDTDIAYIDTGAGDPIVFLHGNPTSSYLWRNIIPHLERNGRCLAPDLVGVGSSGKAPHHSYRFIDHARYLDAWFDALALHRRVTLVVHDWGSALGFYWAQRYPERIKGLVYMEALVRPLIWEEWPEQARSILTGAQREFCRSWPNQEEVTVKGIHFVQEDAPTEIGEAIAGFLGRLS